jgi:hypothetical protein
MDTNKPPTDAELLAQIALAAHDLVAILQGRPDDVLSPYAGSQAPPSR